MAAPRVRGWKRLPSRRGGAAAIPIAARVLAAADAFQALTETRPHRAAFASGQAAKEVEAMGRGRGAGPEAARAVCESAGVALFAMEHGLVRA